MKPLNLDNKPCSPISSNCVVWQGPDIPCIKLCIGDTVSDVVFAMATELCTILETLKVSNYDLTCFNLQACGPTDFQALIQFLITKICENEGLTPATKDVPTCPDCVVSVAECFVTGTQTTMQLVDYVQLIGERVCSLITEISLINTQITDILIRVTTLENAPVPTFTVPSFTITCQIGSLLSGTNQPIDTLLQEFINNVWCGFYAVTGTTTELTNAIDANCITDGSISLTKSPATMGAGYAGTWIPDLTYSSAADAINNIWISLCDIFNYLSTNAFAITVEDEGITLTSTLSSMDFTGAGVTATAIGNAVTVNIPKDLDTFYAQVSIKQFGANAPTLLNTNIAGEAKINSLLPKPAGNGFVDCPKLVECNIVGFNDTLINTGDETPVSVAEITSLNISFGTFINTGSSGSTFRFTEAGVYLIQAFSHLKPDGSSNINWQTDGVGTYGLGLLASATSSDIWGGNTITTIGGFPQENASIPAKFLAITGDLEVSFSRIIYASSSSVLLCAVQNYTDRDYDGSGYAGADNIGFTITKLNDYTP